MKIRKDQQEKCLNCGNQLRKKDHYCPQCGQKVDQNDLSIRGVFSEFFENYISLDSRLGKTIYPFLFKPGYLSLQFIQGVRRNYANPFRLYIFTSIFFFFCLSGVVEVEESKSPLVNLKKAELHDFEQLSEQEVEWLNKKLPSELIRNINEEKDSSFFEIVNNLKLISQRQVVNALHDSSVARLGFNRDSLNEKHIGVSYGKEDDDGGMQFEFDLADLEPYRYDQSYTDEMLLDTLSRGEEMGFYKRILMTRLIHVYRADAGSLNRYILGNLSLAMFVLIPLYAFFQLLLYWRRNSYYVAHLIHTIYLQSFAFFCFGILLLLHLLPALKGSLLSMLTALFFLIFAIYYLRSFAYIYRQKRYKLFLKSIFLCFIYVVLGLVVFIGEVVVSFLLY